MTPLRWAFFAVLCSCAARGPLPAKAIQLNDSGAAALASGDLGTAEARLSLAVEYNPRFTEAWVNLGMVALERGDYRLAERDLRRARELNPDLPAPRHALGVLAERRGDWVAAEGHYRAALKVDPGFPSARANLGRLLFARGAFDDAREQFLRLTEVAPGTLEGFTGLVESLLRLSNDREADDVLTTTRERFGDLPDVLVLVARQELRRGAPAEAERTLAPLTREGARRATAWAWIGVARLSNGDVEGAGEARTEAQAIDPQDPVAFYLERVLTAAAGTQWPPAVR